MIEVLLALVLGSVAAAPPQPPPEPPVKRHVVETLEKHFDGSMARAGASEPFEVMGGTVGVYLAGYGAVFTSQVNLIVSPNVSPFRLKMSPEEVSRVHERKLRQVPVLKQAMRDMLLHSAQALDAVPLRQQIAVGVNLFYFSWEERSGLPSQLTMHAERGRLLQKPVADNAIVTEEQ